MMYRGEHDSPRILLAPTVTSLPPGSVGAVIVSGSHGGRYPGYCAAKGGVRAIVLNDAGTGKDGAGIASLPYLEVLGIAAATVSHASCRIGDSADMLARGRISHANTVALSVGVAVGMRCEEAVLLLRQAPLQSVIPDSLGESRDEVTVPGARRRILLLDSAALVQPEDAGHIVVTGSHGGLVGGKPTMALRTEGFAGIFNDAGGGIDGAGFTRLPALDQRRIAAFTVSAASARIGEARSTFEDGIVSAINQTAFNLGGRVGDRAADLLKKWAVFSP